ncbi:putative quinol monooxygenase [Pseudonocardia eucalypti]|uniref:Quinol monooxygenase n=2 Tax=Pseudonocardia eucalypti TaxID=648755 RepID=A0ABP9PTX0_9PSEU
MIFIVVKFTLKPEYSENWLERVNDFTTATRAEPGNIFFEWSKSVEESHQFVLCEAFRDGEAGSAHVNSDHFRAAMSWFPDAVIRNPQIVNVEVPGEDWMEMAEVQPR